MTKKRALVAIPLLVLVAVVTVALIARSDLGTADQLGAATTSDTAGSAGSAADSAAEPATDQSSGDLKSGLRQATAAAPLSRAVISTGQVTLHTKEMAKARAEVIRLVGSWGGAVADEQSTSDDHGRMASSTMTLRVPSNRFDEAMTAFGTLGEVEQQSRKSEDVTTQVIDNDARIRAAERSIRQIENLLSRAEKLGDIIAIESDLARRQADLDSLKSQQAWLSDQTSLSTINLYLSRPAAPRHDPRGEGLPGRAAERLARAGSHDGRAAHRARCGAPVRGAGARARRTRLAGRTPPPGPAADRAGLRRRGVSARTAPARRP